MRARFEALYMGVLTAASNLGCIFSRILTSGLEQCVWNTNYDCKSLFGSLLTFCHPNFYVSSLSRSLGYGSGLDASASIKEIMRTVANKSKKVMLDRWKVIVNPQKRLGKF